MHAYSKIASFSLFHAGVVVKPAIITDDVSESEVA